MNKKYIAIFVTMIMLVCTGYYFTSHPQYPTYDRRHKAAFAHINEGKYRQAERDMMRAIKLKPKNLDGYGALMYIYDITGQSEKMIETSQKAMDMGFSSKDISNLKTAYSRLRKYNAAYMTNENNEIFIYYGHDGNPKYRHETYKGGDYVKSKYNYENGRIVSETFEKHEDIYTWPEETMEYIYDEQGRLIQKNDPTRGRIKYYYDENGNISLIDYRSKYSTGNGKRPYKEYYENGVLVKTQSSSGYDTIDKETFYDADGAVTRVNKLYKSGNIEKYYLYTYAKDGRRDVTICNCYYSDDVLAYKETITAVGINPDKTVTEYYNYKGEVVKITTELADGTVTDWRPSDDIPNARPLTQEEIDTVNNTDHKLGWFYKPFDTPQDVSVNDFMKFMPKDGYLTDKNKEELANLKREGVKLSYDSIEIELVWYVSYARVKQTDMKAMLAEYINVPYEQLRKPASYPYSQQYDTYYISRSKKGYITTQLTNTDLEPDNFICIGGEVGENNVKLYAMDRTIVLEKEGDRYYISAVIEADNSHLSDQPQSTPAPTPAPSPEPEVKYNYVLKNQILPRDASKGWAYNDAMAKYDEIIKKELSYEDMDYSGGYYPYFTLYELTNDGIPELVFQYMWGHMSAYSYINGKVTMLALPTGGGGDGGKDLLKNGVVAGHMHKLDYNEYGFYTYNPDGSANKVEFGMYWDYDKQGYRLEINGKEVTREEYNGLYSRTAKFTAIMRLHRHFTHIIKYR